MKVMAQMAMVMNLDKCIGCHTCSVTCKQAWTNRAGTEYVWFNNVETRPGLGYPRAYQDQDRWRGGWIRDRKGRLKLRDGGRLAKLARIFSNPKLPSIDDYYEPWTYDYENLTSAPLGEQMPVAPPRSLISGKPMKVSWSANWDDDLGGSPEIVPQDPVLAKVGEQVRLELEETFMFYLPRICEHCLNPACVASCPSGAIYKREDDVSAGIYRPMYQMTYRAAFDENKRLTAMHIKGGGVPESPLHANRFPAGALDNYLAESWAIPSNITIGAFRAPRSNFNAAAEQSFLDEISEYMGKDPIAFRLELLQRAKDNPVGKTNDYDASRYMGVLELVRDKSGWGKPENAGKKRGVSAYFCHNSYAAQVIDLQVKGDQVTVDQVTTALDCGVVVNPEGAKNMAEGAAIDGIGNALFGQLTLTDGKTDQKNFDTYRMIRHNEAPKKIDVHFVKNEIDPTGLGEPPFPPVFAAVANALYKATGKRFYQQPFQPQLKA